MALTKNDCILLLADILKKLNVDTKELSLKVLSNSTIPIDVIKFINDHREFEVHRFYEKLRDSYNNKHSKLYRNIVLSDEVELPKEVLTTLASLNLQILLFAKSLDNPAIFYRLARLAEINYCLFKYATDSNLVLCNELLRLIKADLKAFEMIS